MSSNKTTNDKGKKSDEKSKSTAPKPAANTSSNSSGEHLVPSVNYVVLNKPVSHSRSNVTSSQLPKPTEKATKDRRDPASSTTSPQSTKSAQKLPETVAKTSQPTMTKQKPHYPASESKGDVEDRMGKMSIKQAPSTWEDVKKSIISGEYATLSHEELLKAIEAGTLGKGVPAKAASKDAKKPITNEKARQDAAAADKKEYIRLSKEMLVDAYFYREAGVWVCLSQT